MAGRVVVQDPSRSCRLADVKEVLAHALFLGCTVGLVSRN